MSNRDADKINHIIQLVRALKLDHELEQPSAGDVLATIHVKRPAGSQTSFREIKKALGGVAAQAADADQAGEPRRQRYQSRDERRFRVAQTVRQYCIEHGLRIWDDDANAWEYAIFTAVSKERLVRWGAQFADASLGFSGTPDLSHYFPTPVWDGSGDLVVIEPSFFADDEHLERAIGQPFLEIDIEAAGITPVALAAGDEQARNIIRLIRKL